MEEVGGELPSFHTFIRLSHNLAAEKLNHDKNWGKRWGCEVALQVLQQIGKKQPWWHLWSAGEAGTENLCWIKVSLVTDLPKGRVEKSFTHFTWGQGWFGLGSHKAVFWFGFSSSRMDAGIPNIPVENRILTETTFHIEERFSSGQNRKLL